MIIEEVLGASVTVEIRAATLEACMTEIEAYLRRWHPWGYGTDISEPRRDADGQWRARGRRQRSAD